MAAIQHLVSSSHEFVRTGSVIQTGPEFTVKRGEEARAILPPLDHFTGTVIDRLSLDSSPALGGLGMTAGSRRRLSQEDMGGAGMARNPALARGIEWSRIAGQATGPMSPDLRPGCVEGLR
jgi:hypothetical protein